MDVEKYTVTVRYQQGDTTGETFNSCTDMNANGEELTFTDRNGKNHKFYGVSYHIAEE
jgi:hypothetical protein